MKHTGEKVHRAGQKVRKAAFLLCVASFSVGLDGKLDERRKKIDEQRPLSEKEKPKKLFVQLFQWVWTAK